MNFVELVAKNVLWVLLIVAVFWLCVTAVFWHGVRRFGPRLWDVAQTLWNAWRESSLASRMQRVPIIGPIVIRAMTVLRYLGVYAVLAFAGAALALAAFFELADEIGVDESLAQFDADLAEALSTHVSHDVLSVFATITMLGDRNFLTALAVLVLLVLLIAKRWMLAGAWAIATAAGGLLNLLLKEMFERPRPVHDHGLVTETSFSFPSGHASGSMLIYSLLGYLIVRHTPAKWHIPAVVTMVALIIFVGSSRVILQVHYFSDVLAGYASAAAWVALCIAGLEAARWREERDGHRD